MNALAYFATVFMWGWDSMVICADKIAIGKTPLPVVAANGIGWAVANMAIDKKCSNHSTARFLE